MTKKKLMVIKSQIVEFGRMPMSMPCTEGTVVSHDLPCVVDMYLKETQELKISKEEMELIMRGESSLNLPPKQREELIRQKLEADKRDRIEKVMVRELEYLNVEIGEKMEELRKENEALLA